MTGRTSARPGFGRTILILIGLFLTVGLVLLRANEFGEHFMHLDRMASRDLFWWPLLLATLFYVVAIERRPLSSIGLVRPGWTTLLFGVVGAVLVFAIEPVLVIGLHALHLNPNAGAATAQKLNALPYWYKLTLVTRAAIVEEVIFRGYAIARLEELSGSRTLAVLLSTAAFAAAHLAFWGWVPLIGVSAAGLILALLFVWRRDLGANMIAHFIIDGVALLV